MCTWRIVYLQSLDRNQYSNLSSFSISPMFQPKLSASASNDLPMICVLQIRPLVMG